MSEADPDPAALSQGLRLPGESPVLERLSDATLELTRELGVGPNGNIDLFFVAFLRLMARFGVFSFGPVTIYVPLIEQIAAATATPTVNPESLVRFSALVQAERRRLGSPRIDELHVLLAFMRLGEGLPGRVFGELGVRPEEVEGYARSGGVGDQGVGERLYSPEEAAEYLGIHVQTVRAWIRSGRLRASRLAGQRALRIRASELMTVLEPVDAPGREA